MEKAIMLEMARSADVLSPHPALGDYYGREAHSKRGFLDRAFNRAAADYDRIEQIMAFGSGRRYRREALLRTGLRRGMHVLDVAVGTGLVAREQISLVGDRRLVVGLDPSMAMMSHAVHELGIKAILGVGERLPLADRQFDFVSMGYALRHLEDVRAALLEFFRVLQPGGRVCILEISRPEQWARRTLLRTYLRYVVPAIARLTTRGPDSTRLWQYYWDTIDACVPPAAIVGCLRDCGFIRVTHHLELGMFSEYAAERPAA